MRWLVTAARSCKRRIAAAAAVLAVLVTGLVAAPASHAGVTYNVPIDGPMSDGCYRFDGQRYEHGESWNQYAWSGPIYGYVLVKTHTCRDGVWR
jgi:hypothetical protein